MSKFNATKNTPATETINSAGGTAYSQSAELEIISLLVTSFATNDTYRKESDTYKRLRQLIKDCDKKFVAKAAIYARTVFGMRSITHVVASELAKYVSGQSWAKNFYKQVVKRPDDILEILSYHKAVNGKIPKVMQKGLASAFDKFDAYSLAKYKGEGKEFKMVDAVNVLHPVPNERNSEALKALLKGILKNHDTWESELSAIGQTDADSVTKDKLKADAWAKLIAENKLGYIALVKNLRNIINQAPGAVPAALKVLTNEDAIKKSLVLPFRFLAAFEEVQKMDSSKLQRDILAALNKAVDISLNNVPQFEGETLVVLDVSGSMGMGELGMKSPHIIGSLFAAILAKRNNSDFMVFAENAKYINLNLSDSTITLANNIRFSGGGTNFPSIFHTANKKYDRVVILSDMQGWMEYRDNPKQAFAAYCKKQDCRPLVYSFDLKNYGTMQFPESGVFAIAGFSDKVFDMMALLEKDKKAMINEVKKVKLEG